jgi:hypothetical protein
MKLLTKYPNNYLLFKHLLAQIGYTNCFRPNNSHYDMLHISIKKELNSQIHKVFNYKKVFSTSLYPTTFHNFNIIHNLTYIIIKEQIHETIQ